MNKLFSIKNYHFYLQKWKDRSSSYRYRHFYNLPKATYSPWLQDKEFMAIYEISKHNTLVDIYRCYELWNLIKQTNKLKGDVIEVGVYKGGTGSLLASAVSKEATVFLCDTFSGVVKAGAKDNRYIGGEHADTSTEIVTGLFNKLNLSNFSILKGIFPEESALPIESKKFRFCHIDVDVYQSAKDIFDWVWQRMEKGGVVVFDDYGFAACEGITDLVNNELAPRKDLIMLHNLNGHAVLIKIL
ncbi:MAG: TylF/MycF/NovP-related O-methyltransferase [Ginsengibacter sp.]